MAATMLCIQYDCFVLALVFVDNFVILEGGITPWKVHLLNEDDLLH